MSTATLHGIDITAPGGVEALFAFHRAHFGAARMEEEAGAETDAAGGQQGGQGASADDDKGFPVDTPLERMNATQREAYWKHQARKHEGRAKLFDGLTPEQLKELRDKATRHDELERELMSDKDKAVDEAKRAAKREADEAYRPRIVKAEFRAAAGARITGERLATLLEDLDLSKYVKENGDVDEEKIAKKVDAWAPSGSGTTGHGRVGPSHTGLGRQANSEEGAGSQGRAMAAKRFGKAGAAK